MVDLSLELRSPRVLMRREVIIKPPPRRTHPPMVIATIINNSDLEELSPPETEAFLAITTSSTGRSRCG
jgi:hypothetical protein